MGVDLIGVIDHSLTNDELVELPLLIDNWVDILEIIRTGLSKTYSIDYVEQQYSSVKNSYLECEGLDENSSRRLMAEFLQKSLNKWESEYIEEPIFVRIISYFSLIKLHKKTLIIEQIPWHKYSNLNDKEMAEMILSINRVIARKLGQDKIVYFPDSTYPTSCLYNFALAGKSVSEIIKIADDKFPNRPIGITEGIKYKFFIDTLTDDLMNLEDQDDLEKYWKWNQLKGVYERDNI